MAHGLSCSAACRVFPDQGSNPCPLHWQAPPGNPYPQTYFSHQVYTTQSMKSASWGLLMCSDLLASQSHGSLRETPGATLRCLEQLGGKGQNKKDGSYPHSCFAPKAPILTLSLPGMSALEERFPWLRVREGGPPRWSSPITAQVKRWGPRRQVVCPWFSPGLTRSLTPWSGLSPLLCSLTPSGPEAWK